jgi:hypothetical protein
MSLVAPRKVEPGLSTWLLWALALDPAQDHTPRTLQGSQLDLGWRHLVLAAMRMPTSPESGEQARTEEGTGFVRMAQHVIGAALHDNDLLYILLEDISVSPTRMYSA